MFGYVIANMEQLDEAQRRRYQQVYLRAVPGPGPAARGAVPADAHL